MATDMDMATVMATVMVMEKKQKKRRKEIENKRAEKK